jgi:hypothetical protein
MWKKSLITFRDITGTIFLGHNEELWLTWHENRERLGISKSVGKKG